MNMFRKVLCSLGMCPCRPASDETGCWGECIYCGKRFAFIDRATLRAFADREMAEEINRIKSDRPYIIGFNDGWDEALSKRDDRQ